MVGIWKLYEDDYVEAKPFPVPITSVRIFNGYGKTEVTFINKGLEGIEEIVCSDFGKALAKQPKEYFDFGLIYRNPITNELYNLTAHDTGEAIMSSIYNAEELYSEGMLPTIKITLV